jgi:uncharacterized protein YdiU (UPF0061 family)
VILESELSTYVLSNHMFEIIKAIVQLVSYLVAALAALGALLTYRSNSRRERAKWAIQVYEKFFESNAYKEMRNKLDCASDAAEVQQLVQQKPPAFTDYLNFFEMIAFIAETKQLSKRDALSLFQYYLQCLKRHSTVMNYVNDKEKGFEKLSGFLRKTEL